MTFASPTTSLAAIITAARAGSIGYAASLFEAGGWAGRTADPAAQATRARLLKDRALRAPLPDRQALLFAAADAYGTADALRPAPYTRINQATMLYLAGNRDRACAIAQDLLGWIAQAQDLAETPYFIAATRAEAQLLCGDRAAAAAAMRAACAADPDGWPDRASTLRQFALILAATGADQTWLDEFRPPRSLNYAGHLGIGAAQADGLRAGVSDWLAAQAIGFGFGALAAGADIVIAEALIARGAQLHVVLPTRIDDFIAQSVAPYDPAWTARFAACLAAAHAVHCVTSVTGAYEPLATQLAADVAMGAAVLNARRLQSTAWQLLVIDDAPGPYGGGLGTRAIGERWRDRDRQHCLVAPRSAPVPASGARTVPEGRHDRRLAAMLMITFDGLDGCDEGRFSDAVDSVIAPFRERCAALAMQPDLTLPIGNARLVAFADPDAAWHLADALLALPPLPLPLRLAGHYGIAHWLDDPAALVGRATADLARIAAAALPGVLTASETLASALSVNLSGAMIAEHIGEAGDIRLFALTAIQ
jgi:hypothetical protein